MELTHITDEQIQELLDGNMLPNERQLRFHISTCEQCQSTLEQYELLYDEIARPAEVALSPDFAVRMADRFEEAYAGNSSRSLLERSIWSGVGIAAAMALFFFVDWNSFIQAMAQNETWQTVFSQEQLKAWTTTLASMNLNPSALAVAAAAMAVFGNMDAILRHLRDRQMMCW